MKFMHKSVELALLGAVFSCASLPVYADVALAQATDPAPVTSASPAPATAPAPTATTPAPVAAAAAATTATPAAAVNPAAPAAATDAPAPAVAPMATSGCELHIFPTRTFHSTRQGWASMLGAVPGLGVLGAGLAAGVGSAVDLANSHNRRMTTEDVLMAYLPADVQLAQLNKFGVLEKLRLPADTVIVAETPAPNQAEAKADPAAKARLKQLEETAKSNQRLTASAATCYSELVVADVLHQKTLAYGTRMFTQFAFRDFRAKPDAPVVSKGMVENKAPDFANMTPEKEPEVRAAIVEAYGKDFTKWVELKLAKK